MELAVYPKSLLAVSLEQAGPEASVLQRRTLVVILE